MSTKDVRVEALLVHRQRLSSLPFRGEHRWIVHCKKEEERSRKSVESCEPDLGQLGHLQSELVDPLWPLHADISVLVNYFCQSIPINLSNGIDNRYQSITTQIFGIDYQYQSINWYRLVSIDIDCHRLSIPSTSIGYPRKISHDWNRISFTFWVLENIMK